jgi:hypothetical protein
VSGPAGTEKIMSADYRDLRAMRVRGPNRRKVPPLDLPVGAVIRVDRVKYRVQDIPTLAPVTGTVVVPAYSEDNQHEHLYLNARRLVVQIGHLP